MLSQQGRVGEANALVNLGYEVFAQLLEQIAPETYETAIGYLQQGLKLSEQLGEIQKLCVSAVWHCPLVLSQPQQLNTWKTAYKPRNFQTICISRL